VLSQKLFSPDRKHLHHRLIDLEFNQKNAVLFLYGVSIFIGVIAVGDDGEDPEDQPGRFLWRRDGFDVHRDVCKDCLLKKELPLIDESGQSLGFIWLIKDLCATGGASAAVGAGVAEVLIVR